MVMVRLYWSMGRRMMILDGKPDVAVLLVVAVEGAGDDVAGGVVDVLLVGQQVDAADVDDAEGVGDLVLGWDEEFEVVVGLFDEILLLAVGSDDAGVGGEGDELVGAESADEQGVEEDGGAEAVEAFFRGFVDVTGAVHGATFGWDPELAIFSRR